MNSIVLTGLDDLFQKALRVAMPTPKGQDEKRDIAKISSTIIAEYTKQSKTHPTLTTSEINSKLGR